MRGVIAALIAVAIMPTSALAAFTAAARDNATIQPSGPRGGSNGKKFFNIEGNANGQFASWGVLDFNATDFGIGFQVTSISNVKLKLVHAPAGFSESGSIKFYVTEDTTTDIQPGSSPLKWDVNFLPEGIGGQLSPRHEAGTGVYDETFPAEHLFVYDLVLDNAAKAYLINQINDKAPIRLVVTPLTDTTAATYAGYTYVLTGGGSGAPVLELEASSGGAESVYPNSFSIMFGSLVSGGLSDLTGSDDSYLVIQNGSTFLITQSPITVEFTGMASKGTTSEVKFSYEGKVNLVGLMQRLDMWDYTASGGAGAFVQVDERSAALTDELINVTKTSDAQNYLKGNGEVRSRLRVRDDTPAFLASWRSFSDLLTWTIS